MGRTTHARRTRERARTSRALHLRAASVIAVAALGIGAAPAIAGTVATDSSHHATTESGSDGGTSDSPTATSTSGASANAGASSGSGNSTISTSGANAGRSGDEEQSRSDSDTSAPLSPTDTQDEQNSGTTSSGESEELSTQGNESNGDLAQQHEVSGDAKNSGKLTIEAPVKPGAEGVTVSGKGFPSSTSQVNLSVTLKDQQTERLESVSLSKGAFSARSVKLPEPAKAGATYTVHATAAGTSNDVAENFTVSKKDRSLTLDPTTATAGENVRAKVTGFPEETKVTANLKRKGTDLASSSEVKTNDDGSAQLDLTIPAETSSGTYEVVVASVNGGATESATIEIKSKQATPTISLTSDESTVKPGADLTVQGEDFPDAGATVTLRDPTPGSPDRELATVAKGKVHDGAFSVPVTIPANTASGEYTIVAASNSRNASAKLPVTVKASQGSSDGGGDDESGAGNGSGTGSDTSTDTGSANSPSSPTTGSSSPTTSSPSSKDDSSSRSRTSDVPSSSRSRDRSDEIELNSPAEDPASNDEKSDESEKKDDTSTKSEDSEKAKDEDTKTSASPQETSNQPVSAQQDQQTEAAATMKDDDPSTGATTVTKDENSDPLVKLFNTIGGQDASGMSRIRQVFVATLGLGFLTALGFTAASWLSRRSGTHSARAGLRQLFHRRH